MKDSIYSAIHSARSEHPDEFMVLASHYPVICSQIDPHCRDSLANMPDFYDYISTQFNGKGLVDLYIGSHMHQY
jgi:hypothetical protein